jgi:hypothetical protein
MTQAIAQQTPERVECPAAKDPAVRRFILAGIIMGLGIWCFIDSYVWPTVSKSELGEFNKMLKYYFNHIGAFALTLGALIPLIGGIRMLKSTLVADESGIGYVGSRQIPWSAVKHLDASNLADKGILRLQYDMGQGEQTLVLDSWKLQNFKPLVALVEQKVHA